jgi:ribosomal protein L24E
MAHTISTITLNVALALNSVGFSRLDEFATKADLLEYIPFTHHNFFYSYPEWGKKWANGKEEQFHRVHTKCHTCGYIPNRNYAGVGTMYLVNDGHARFRIICHKHKSSYSEWQATPLLKKAPKQLEFF